LRIDASISTRFPSRGRCADATPHEYAANTASGFGWAGYFRAGARLTLAGALPATSRLPARRLVWVSALVCSRIYPPTPGYLQSDRIEALPLPISMAMAEWMR